ncbi:MAG TPA: hypothetical protein VJ785_06120 [Anaerolineales bacterium]|nr:hypothetical protein [Anaerolineales bacterium]
MLAKRMKLIVFVCLSLCFTAVICVLSIPRITSLLKMMQVGSQGQAAIKSLMVIIDKRQREELFDKLRGFAEKHGFEHELTDFNTNGENFQFWMARDDLRIIASNVPPDATRVPISFYAKYPGYPVDEKIVDDLFDELKNLIGEIPHVTITEDK